MAFTALGCDIRWCEVRRAAIGIPYRTFTFVFNTAETAVNCHCDTKYYKLFYISYSLLSHHILHSKIIHLPWFSYQMSRPCNSHHYFLKPSLNILWAPLDVALTWCSRLWSDCVTGAIRPLWGPCRGWAVVLDDLMMMSDDRTQWRPDWMHSGLAYIFHYWHWLSLLTHNELLRLVHAGFIALTHAQMEVWATLVPTWRGG